MTRRISCLRQWPCASALLFLWSVAAIVACPGAVFSEVLLKSAAWSLGRQGEMGRRVYESIDRWEQPPAAKLSGKLRVVVTLVNRGPKAAKAVLLRYCVSARLVHSKDTTREGLWTVPVRLQEKRIPMLRANQALDVPIDNLLPESYFKKAHLSGFWPDALRLQVMVEPRLGEGLEERLLERTLPIRWKEAR